MCGNICAYKAIKKAHMRRKSSRTSDRETDVLNAKGERTRVLLTNLNKWMSRTHTVS